MGGEFVITKNGSAFLNLVRLLAAQAVVVGHLLSWLNIFPKLQPPYLPYFQGIGVVVFFVLSGFVISFSTAQKFKSNPDYSFKEFFIERFARIYSAYLPCLVFIVVIDLIIILIDGGAYNYYSNFNVRTFIGNVFMLQEHPLRSYFGPMQVESFGTGRPLWTLAIEWWIYFWFGFLYIVLIKKKQVNPLTILIFIIFSIIPYYNYSQGMGDGLMLPWLLGCIIFVALPAINKLELNKILILLFVLFLSFLMFRQYRKIHFTYNDSIYAIYLSVSLFLLIALFNRINFSERLQKLITVFADFSFSVYLLHYTIISLMMVLLKDRINPYLFFMLAFVLSNVVSYFFASVTEMKYKTLRAYMKKKLLPAKA